MRILHVGDLHCYMDNYGTTSPDGEHSRLKDWKCTAEALVLAAVEHGVDLAVFPGDLFRNSRPSPAAIMAVTNLFRALREHGIPVVACAGNHDAPGVGQPGPVDELASLTGHREWGITTPQVVNIPSQTHPLRSIDVAVLPYVKPAAMVDQTSDPAELAAAVSAKLVEVARGLAAQCITRPRILMAHWTIQGSVSSSGQVMGVGVEPAIPLSELTGLGFDAVLMGHIHKPQVLNESPFVGYAGSLERVDFGEERDPRGVYIIDTERGTHEWVDLPARRFYTIDLSPMEIAALALSQDATGCARSLAADHDARTRDSIVRVRYQATEEQAKRIDAVALLRELQSMGAHYVAGIIPEIIRADRSREATITEHTGPAEALERWLAMRTDVTPERRAAVLALAQSTLTEVA